MKKLLGVIGILALAAAMLPAQGHADLRGSFAPITIASGFSQGCETASHRPDDGTGTMLFPVDGRLEPEWITFTARSLVPGKENARSIYLHLNAQQSGYFAVLKTDPNSDISYFDPAWSYDGKYLAYIKAQGLASGLFVQQFFDGYFRFTAGCSGRWIPEFSSDDLFIVIEFGAVRQHVFASEQASIFPRIVGWAWAFEVDFDVI